MIDSPPSALFVLAVRLLARSTSLSRSAIVVAVPVTPTLSMAVVGSPAYFERHGVPKTPADLVQHNCINYRYSGSGAVHDWDFNEPGKKGQHFTQAVTGNLTTNDDEGMTRAALQGLGLMQNIDIAIHQHLADGRLVRVLREAAEQPEQAAATGRRGRDRVVARYTWPAKLREASALYDRLIQAPQAPHLEKLA